MDEVALYNLHASAASSGYAAKSEAKRYAEDLMITHLHLEHKMGVRELARRFNRKMAEIKNVIEGKDEA